MSTFSQALLAALVSDAVVALLLGLLLKRYTEQVSNDVRTQYEQLSTAFRARYSWKEKALAELLAPLHMQLNRTERAFRRYAAGNLYLEARILKEGNEVIRNLLIEKGYLMPLELLPDADALIEHYDIWLEEFARVRDATRPELRMPFVFVGPQGYPFPRPSADRFQEMYRRLWREVYGGGA